MLHISPDPLMIFHTVMGRFYSLEEINPELKLLSDNYHTIAEEFNENKDKLVWTNWTGNNHYTSVKANPYDGWQVAALYLEYNNYIEQNRSYYEQVYKTKAHIDYERDIIYSDNADYLPTLTNFAYQSGLRQRVGISVVHPGKAIDWHVDNDPSDDDYITIRGLWGLDIKSTEDEYAFLALNTQKGMFTEYFESNKFMFFWGSTTHMVYNTLSTPRYCLCFDQKVKIDDLL